MHRVIPRIAFVTGVKIQMFLEECMRRTEPENLLARMKGKGNE